MNPTILDRFILSLLDRGLKSRYRFKAARDRAGLDPRIVLYSARHSYGTDVMEATGNLFAVSKSMGHADIKSMEPYQHQKTEPLVIAINQRNAGRMATSGVGHSFGHTNSITA